MKLGLRHKAAIGLIEFDFACRSAELPRSLSCEYRASPGVEVLWDPKTWLLLLRLQPIIVLMKGRHGCEKPEVVADIHPRFRFVLPVEELTAGETLRWRYGAWLGRVHQPS